MLDGFYQHLTASPPSAGVKNAIAKHAVEQELPPPTPPNGTVNQATEWSSNADVRPMATVHTSRGFWATTDRTRNACGYCHAPAGPPCISRPLGCAATVPGRRRNNHLTPSPAAIYNTSLPVQPGATANHATAGVP